MNLKVFTSKFVGTGPSSYKKIIYRAAVSQKLRNNGVQSVAVRCVEGVTGDAVASRWSWPPFSSDPNPCDFFLWDTLKDKK